MGKDFGTQPGVQMVRLCRRQMEGAAHTQSAAPVDLEATPASALEFVTLEDLKAHVLK